MTNFPNVFYVQSVMLEHTKPIVNMCPFGLNVVTVTEEDSEAKNQRIIVSSLKDASI